jgi:hypothetical protein
MKQHHSPTLSNHTPFILLHHNRYQLLVTINPPSIGRIPSPRCSSTASIISSTAHPTTNRDSNLHVHACMHARTSIEPLFTPTSSKPCLVNRSQSIVMGAMRFKSGLTVKWTWSQLDRALTEPVTLNRMGDEGVPVLNCF